MTVKDAEETTDFNHYFRLKLEQYEKANLTRNPENLVAFVKKLSAKVASDRDVSHVTIKDVSDDGTTVCTVNYSYTGLSAISEFAHIPDPENFRVPSRNSSQYMSCT